MGVIGCEQRIIDSAIYLCTYFLEPIRAYSGCPVRVHDGYRDPAHNARVGGKTTSWHLFEGSQGAVDFDVIGIPVQKSFDFVRLVSGLKFDKIICEFSHGSASTLHLQVDRENSPRRLAYTGSVGAGTVYVQVEVK